MRRRPVRFKQLGEFLVGLRRARGWKQSQAADFADRRGLTALTRQVLLRLEAGQTKDPAPEALRAAAALYEIEYAEIVGVLTLERYGAASVPSRHSADLQTGFKTPGEPDAQSPTRVRQLEARLEHQTHELDTYKDIVRRVRPLLLDALAAVGDKDAETDGGKATRSGGHRKSRG